MADRLILVCGSVLGAASIGVLVALDIDQVGGFGLGGVLLFLLLLVALGVRATAMRRSRGEPFAGRPVALFSVLGMLGLVWLSPVPFLLSFGREEGQGVGVDTARVLAPLIGVSLSLVVCWLVWRHARVTALTAATWAALAASGCVGSCAGQAFLEQRAHVRGDAIAEALERVRQREGRYPDALDALVPHEMPAIPRPGQRIFTKDQFDYQVETEGSEYALGHPGTAFTFCSRTSSRREWLCLD